MRTKSSFINLSFAFFGQILGVLVSFFSRIVFIEILGTEYLGLSGLFTNLLSILALVELGIGPAIIYSLYKPLAEKNQEKIKALMRLYQKAYITIGISILVLGIAFTPFLNVLLKTIPDIPYIHLIFLLFVLNSAMSYFFSYKRSLIISDQKRYIATIYRYSFFFILNIVQIIVLYLTHDFILFLICQLIATLVENVLVSRKADKLYPFLKGKNVQAVDRQTLQEISKNVRAMIIHRISGAVVNSTDNILISKFVGLAGVGLYSNYQLILTALNSIISQVFESITAGVGNLGATESVERRLSIFQVVFFINFWIYGFAVTCLSVLINPFIELWIGKDYILSTPIVMVIIINFYLKGMRQSVMSFRNALGLSWYDRHKPIFEAIINLVVSLILVENIGMMGVFIGTIISSLTTFVWVDPYVLYKYGLQSPVFPFFRRNGLYTLVTIITGFIVLEITSQFRNVSVSTFVIQTILCIVVTNGIFLLLFHRTKEFKYLVNMIRNLWRTMRKG